MGNLFTEKLEMCISDKVNQVGLQNMNTHELGEAVDMVKDTAEIDMLKSKKRYYDTLISAMNENQYGMDYDEYGPISGYPNMMGYPYQNNRRGGQMNNMNRSNNNRSGYPGQPRMANGQFAYPNMNNGWAGMDTSKYGYNHDEYMMNRENATPEQRKMMLDHYMDDLFDMGKEMIEDMTPEEKAVWKAKITKMVNL